VATIGLARVSTIEQNLDLQVKALNRAGCKVVFVEKVSGVAAQRRERDKALARCQPGDTLVVWKLDRLGRSLVELLAIVEGLEARGVRFQSLTEHIDTGSPMGRLQLQMLAAFAEFERAIIRERTLAGKAAARAAGKPPGGRRMAGLEPDGATVREDEAEHLREAATRLVAREAMSRIVDDLNAAGVRTAAGGPWEATPLRNLLRRPRMAKVLGAELHARVLALLDEPDRQRQGRPAIHLLSGILTCGKCGQPLYARQASKTQWVYACLKGHGGRYHGCGTVGVSLPQADHLVTEAFLDAVTGPKLAELTARYQRADTAELVRQRDADRDLLTGLARLHATRRIGTEEWLAQRDVVAARIDAAESKLDETRTEDGEALASLPRDPDTLRALWEGWTVETRRTWLRRVLDGVVVRKATTRGRGSDVAARLAPRWRVR